MFLDAFCKSLVGWNEITDQEKDSVLENVYPGLRVWCLELTPEAEADEEQWNQEQIYAAPAAAPPGQSFDELSPRF